MSNVGVIRKWLRTYGYIRYYYRGEILEIYVHRTCADVPLEKGMKVQFEIGKNERGPMAEKVKVIGYAKVTGNTRTKGSAAL